MFRKIDLDDIGNRLYTKEIDIHRPFTIQYSNDGSWEADFYYFRGAKEHYRNGAHFWLCCTMWIADRLQGFQLLMAHRYPRYVHTNLNTNSLLEKQNLYKVLSSEQFKATIQEYSLSLKNSNIPHTYIWEGQVLDAMQISDEWNDQSFLPRRKASSLFFIGRRVPDYYFTQTVSFLCRFGKFEIEMSHIFERQEFKNLRNKNN